MRKLIWLPDGKTHFAEGGWLLPYLVDDVPFDNPQIQEVMTKAKQNPLYNMKDVSWYLVVPPPTDISDAAWKKYISSLPIDPDFTPQQRQIINQTLENITDPFTRAAMISATWGIDVSVYGYNGSQSGRIKLWQPYIVSLSYMEQTFVHEATHTLQQKIIDSRGRNRYVELQALVNELNCAIRQNDTTRIQRLIPYIIDLSWSKLLDKQLVEAQV